jgi:hypothetical protein
VRPAARHALACGPAAASLRLRIGGDSDVVPRLNRKRKALQ